MRRAVALAVAAGCGSSASSPDAPRSDAAAIDALAIASGRYVVLDVRNDAQHMPLAEQRPFNQLGATLRQPDGTWAPVDVAADDTFSFALPESSVYRLALASDGGSALELQLAGPHLDLAARFGVRYDRAPVPANTTLAVTIPNAPTATGNLIIETTGLWASLGRSAGNNASFTVDWTAAPGLLDASAYDRAYATFYDAVGAAPQYSTITAACSADVTMTGGTANPMTCSLAPLALDHCMHVRAHFAAEYTRVQMSIPSTITYPNLGYSWTIYATSVASIGPVGIVQIAGAGFNTMPVTDTDRDQTTYNVPFPGHAPLALMTMQRYRPLQLPGTTVPVYVSAVTQHYVPAAEGCSTPTDVAGSIAIANVISLAGIPLTADDQSLTLDRSRDLDLTWSMAVDGRADYWQANLYALAAQSGATVLALQRRWIVTDPHVAVDPTLLAPGTRYLVIVYAYEGFPFTGAGDFLTSGYPAAPYATSAQPSAVFQVAN